MPDLRAAPGAAADGVERAASRVLVRLVEARQRVDRTVLVDRRRRRLHLDRTAVVLGRRTVLADVEGPETLAGLREADQRITRRSHIDILAVGADRGRRAEHIGVLRVVVGVRPEQVEADGAAAHVDGHRLGVPAFLVVGHGQRDLRSPLRREGEFGVLLVGGRGSEFPLPGHHLAVLVGRTVGELHRFARHDLLGRPREVGHGPDVVVHDPNGLLERRLLRPAVGGNGQLDDILSGLIVGDVLRSGFVGDDALAQLPFADGDQGVFGRRSVGEHHRVAHVVGLLVGGERGVDRHFLVRLAGDGPHKGESGQHIDKSFHFNRF